MPGKVIASGDMDDDRSYRLEQDVQNTQCLLYTQKKKVLLNTS